MPVETPTRGALYKFCDWINRLVCRVMHGVQTPPQSPLPEGGPILLVSDHSSYNDPMVLSATANRPIIYLTAREVYESPALNWLCKMAFFIPVTRGSQDVGAIRAMIRALRRGEVVALFPEGGIDDHRDETGHHGVGYLAIKTGVPVVPASITWDKPRPLTLGRSLLTPGRAVVRYGQPITLPTVSQPDRDSISLATERIMRAIRDLKDPEAVHSL